MKSATKFHRMAIVMLVGLTLLAACAAPTPQTVVVTQIVAGTPVQVEVTREVSVTAAPQPTAVSETPPVYTSWDEVLAAARGTTVYWHMWGGSDTINGNVDSDIGGPMRDLYGITLIRVPLNDTADAVNKVLDEKAAGVETGGSIDMIWINGENFKTLKTAGLVYGPFTDLLPNSKYVNWDDPAMAFDFGFPVEGYESPWGHAQFVMEYDTAQVGDTPPTTFEALQEWIHANPDKFTYPAVPDFTGSVFIRHLFIWAAGGPDPFLGDFDQATFDKYAPKVWTYLNDIEPDLWRGGQTYPEAAAMTDLLANKETAFNMGYGPAGASLNIAKGIYPETIRTFVFDTGTLANNNYVAIPFNANNPAGAMVVANYMISPQFQLTMADPNRWGWLITADPRLWGQHDQDVLASYELGVATLSADVLAAHALPEPNGAWVTAMEEGWIKNVLEK